MMFNRHSAPTTHAFLSASKYHWLDYNDDKLLRMYVERMSAARGTQLHALAHDMIQMKVKAPDTPTTFNMYVNDCIGFRMTTELLLIYSEHSYGTADAISFRDKKLRISDLKNGVTPASMKQLRVYAALFCLEYHFRPFEIDIELRIYQNDDVELEHADPDDIMHVMDRIVYCDKLVREMREEY
jgi:hypothetical protein